MSRTWYYRQVLPEPAGEYVDAVLALKIGEEVDHDWIDGPIDIKKGSRTHAFVRGLAASGTVAGAQDLAGAVERLGEVEIYVEW